MGTTRGIRAFAALSALALLHACATLPAEDRDPGLYGTETVRAVITARQLQGTTFTTTQDALRTLRPSLFTQRAALATGDPYRGAPALYVDGQFQGGLEFLSTIPLYAVRSIQILGSSEGHSRFGRFHPGGVVEVNVRR
ncbi:MAG: hypothetical protein JWL61_2798 [Gemmatimonadetes bacterium]|jgi:hypothetical protein|nr:hypothetical protein [Gemmatimonadota bacterium]